MEGHLRLRWHKSDLMSLKESAGGWVCRRVAGGDWRSWGVCVNMIQMHCMKFSKTTKILFKNEEAQRRRVGKTDVQVKVPVTQV